MTNLITEARELCEKAAPGKWHWEGELLLTDAEQFLVLKPYYDDDTDNVSTCVMPDDAAFIARSRTLIPELCDALEKAAKKNDELMRELAQLARESVERDKALARLEAEVEGWAKAEQEGRLLVLPCKVGDAVYTVDLDCEDNPDHTKMCFCWNKSCKSCEKAYLRVWENHTKTVDIRSIVAEMGLCGEDGGFGKTVFLTRSEAEEALKGGTP